MSNPFEFADPSSKDPHGKFSNSGIAPRSGRNPNSGSNSPKAADTSAEDMSPEQLVHAIFFENRKDGPDWGPSLHDYGPNSQSGRSSFRTGAGGGIPGGVDLPNNISHNTTSTKADSDQGQPNIFDEATTAFSSSYDYYTGQAYGDDGYMQQMQDALDDYKEANAYADRCTFSQNNDIPATDESGSTTIPGETSPILPDQRKWMADRGIIVPTPGMTKEKWAEAGNAIQAWASTRRSEGEVSTIQAQNAIRQTNSVLQVWSQVINSLSGALSAANKNLGG